MTTAEQASAGPTTLESALKVGLDTLSYNQVIKFEKYRQVVLPLDGYVFWIKAGANSPSALLNVSPLNTFGPNYTGASGSNLLNAPGSLHYATEQRQEEDATYAINNVIFTSQVPVTDFNALAPDELYIATSNGIRFAFSSRGRYYQQANLHHYVGDAIYAPMDSQVVDDPRLLDARNLIVSNSLPGWLALNTYTRPYPIPLPRPRFLLYPSFLSPSNMAPPYGIVHISPDMTEAVAAGPLYNQRSSQYSASRDHVTVTLYGVDNDTALSFLLNVLQYSMEPGPFSITNMPAVRDDKRTQSELTVIAMKKRIEFDVFYYQSAVRDTARQLITEAATVVEGTNPPLPV